MWKLLKSSFIFVVTFLTGCVGVDVVPFEINTPELKIVSNIDTLKVGDAYQLEYIFINEQGLTDSTTAIIWNSVNEQTALVDNKGVVTALAKGKAIITASVNSFTDSISFHVGTETVSNNQRSIVFTGRNGYEVKGTGILSQNETSQELILQFNNDFSAQNGPGLVVYLSNNEASVNGALELVPLKNNSGSQTYNITQILIDNGNSTQVELNTFNYILVHCKPFNIVFGVGTLE